MPPNRNNRGRLRGYRTFLAQWLSAAVIARVPAKLLSAEDRLYAARTRFW